MNIKQSPNTAKLFVDFLMDQKTSDRPQQHLGVPRGGTTHQGAPGHRLFALQNPKYSKTLQGRPRSEVPLPQGLCIHEIQSRPRSGTLPEGEIITSGHLHHPDGHHDEEGVVHLRG